MAVKGLEENLLLVVSLQKQAADGLPQNKALKQSYC